MVTTRCLLHCADVCRWTNNTFYSDEDSGCIAGQTQTSNGVDWMAGTFVWTAHGERKASQ